MTHSILQPLPQPFRVVIVEDDVQRLMKLYEACWNEVKNSLEMKGFSKGKVPRSIAERKMGIEKLYKPVIDVLIQEGLSKLDVDFCQLEEVNVEWQTEEKPLTLVVKGYLRPEVLECDYKNIITKYERLLVTDEEVNSVLQRSAVSEAIEKEVEDISSFSEDDLAKVQFVVDFMMEDLKTSKILANQPRYRAPLGKVVWGFEPELTKYRPEDVFEFKTVLSDDFFHTDSRGKEVVFKIKLIKLYTLEVPQVNDNLAQKIGYKDLNDMRIKVVQDLEENKKTVNQMLYRDHIMGMLIAKTKITPIPDKVVITELDMMLEGAVRNASNMQGVLMTVEEFLEASKMTREKWRASNWELAKRKLLGNLALEYIAKQEGINPSEQECFEMLRQILPENSQIDESKIDKNGLRHYAVLKLAQDRLVELVEKDQREKSDG